MEHLINIPVVMIMFLALYGFESYVETCVRHEDIFIENKALFDNINCSRNIKMYISNYILFNVYLIFIYYVIT